MDRCEVVVADIVGAAADLPRVGISHCGIRSRGRELSLKAGLSNPLCNSRFSAPGLLAIE